MQTKAQKRRGALARMAKAVREPRTARGATSVTVPAEELDLVAATGSDSAVLKLIREAEATRNRKGME